MASRQFVTTDHADGRYIDLIRYAYENTRPTAIFTAVAYATQSGVGELTSSLKDMPCWSSIRKKWLVGIDYCRSDPLALIHLGSLSKSEVRVFDGEFVVGRRGCAPRYSYHPKLYALQGKEHSAVVVGSGNLSHTGLRLGVEAGVSIADPNREEFGMVKSWFGRHWNNATPLDDISAEYEQRYRASENRKNPLPSDDDAAPESAGRRGQLTPEQLRRLAVCKHLWIQAGNLHENRGMDRHGNQLMLKRNTRVFFGFPARDLQTDTVIGSVAIKYGGHLRPDCSIRFSNNSMDVLTLPIPNTEGPPKYDQETLCFEQTGVRQFRLVIGKKGDVSKWKRQAKVVGGCFKMKSGREWGVF